MPDHWMPAPVPKEWSQVAHPRQGIEICQELSIENAGRWIQVDATPRNIKNVTAMYLDTASSSRLSSLSLDEGGEPRGNADWAVFEIVGNVAAGHSPDFYIDSAWWWGKKSR